MSRVLIERLFFQDFISQVGPAADVATFPYETPADAELVSETVTINGFTNCSEPKHFINSNDSLI